MEESQKVLEILQDAMQMEKDGREFYLKASQKSQTTLARNLFEVLADEEIEHQKAAKAIYDAIKTGKDWPDQDVTANHAQRMESIFAATLKEAEQQTQIASDDLEAVRISLQMEEKSFNFYKNRSREATYPAEIDFYEALAHEEQNHITSLRDTEEYLTDAEGWMMKKQHITLDGD